LYGKYLHYDLAQALVFSEFQVCDASLLVKKALFLLLSIDEHGCTFAGTIFIENSPLYLQNTHDFKGLCK